jgi:hypothetical protein
LGLGAKRKTGALVGGVMVSGECERSVVV